MSVLLHEFALKAPGAHQARAEIFVFKCFILTCCIYLAIFRHLVWARLKSSAPKCRLCKMRPFKHFKMTTYSSCFFCFFFAHHRKWFLEKSLQSAVDLFSFLLYLSTFFPKTHSELSQEKFFTYLTKQDSAFLLLHVQILPDTFGIYRSELTLTLMESTVKADRENGEQLFNEGSLI